MRNKGTLGLKNVGITIIVKPYAVSELILLIPKVKKRRLTTVADIC